MPTLPQPRRAVLRLSAALLLAVPFASARAQPANDADRAILAPIEALDQALIAIMKAGQNTPFQQRAEMLAPAVERALDLTQILEVSVGLGWSTLTTDQQAALLTVFRRYTIATYVENFDSYDGQRFEVDPATRALADGRQIVGTKIIPRTGDPHTLDYVMRKTADGWKVVDVLADGTISRVAVLRSDFGSLLDSGGAPALEARLQEKTDALSRG
jgi:phospholipid transport system substrate-binding protein